MTIKFFQSCSGFLLPGLLCLLLSCKKDSDNSSPTTNKLPVFTNPAASPVSDITAVRPVLQLPFPPMVVLLSQHAVLSGIPAQPQPLR
jgi:hypothetical protein